MKYKITDKEFEALDDIKGKRIMYAGLIYIFSEPIYMLNNEKQGFFQQYKCQRYLTELKVSYVEQIEEIIQCRWASDETLKMLFSLNLKNCRRDYLSTEKQFNLFNNEINKQL
jgi:hypothetical protein